MHRPILNIKSDAIPANAVFIARPSPLGNPYAIGPDGDRDTVIERYRQWLHARIRERDPVVCTALLGIHPEQPLACHCAPKRCHGEIIAEALDNLVPVLREPRVPTLRYAGIGSRSTPEPVLGIMRRIAKRLAARGYTLLSGGAKGADSAFEEGADKKAIFLPWPGFNGRPESTWNRPTSEAFRMAAAVHPAWSKLRDSAQALMARNSHQILGADLHSPVDFVVCWTPDGCETEAQRSQRTGGTGQAIALANRWGILVVNLAHGKAAMDRLAKLVNQ